MQQVPKQPLEYSSPSRERPVAGFDARTGVALVFGALSMLAAGMPDPGGMKYELKVVAGFFGGGVSLLLGAVALGRLIRARNATVFNVAAAAAAIACAGLAILAGVRLYCW